MLEQDSLTKEQSGLDVGLPDGSADRRTVNIVVACDDRYAQHTFVTLASALRYSPQSSFNIYVLVPTSFSFSQQMYELSGFGGKCDISIVKVDEGLVGDLFVSGHLSVAAYLRLLISEALPVEIGRVLYLDSDIIVQGELAELWLTDLQGNIVAAVAEADESFEEPKRKLGLGPDSIYFNSGVLLIDLMKWRQTQIGAEALRVCRERKDILTWHDQCALNYVLAGKVKELSIKWNLQTRHLFNIGSEVLAARLSEAHVIHFTRSFKPWHYQCEHPLKSQYWQLLRNSPWSDYVPPDRTLTNILKRQIARILPKAAHQWLRKVVHAKA